MTSKELLEKRNQFEVGEVVYYIKRKDPHKPTVWIAKVIELYQTEVWLALLDIKFEAFINGINTKELQTPSRWMKFPEKLIYTQYSALDTISAENNCKINDKAGLQTLLDKGILVEVSENDYTQFATQVDVNKGWRIVKEYYGVKSPLERISLTFDKVYKTYDEADAVVKAELAEFKRIENLSDREWAIEEIQKTLDKYAKAIGITDEEKEQIMQRFLSMQSVEDIETRVDLHNKVIEYKYVKNKRWVALK